VSFPFSFLLDPFPDKEVGCFVPLFTMDVIIPFVVFGLKAYSDDLDCPFDICVVAEDEEDDKDFAEVGKTRNCCVQDKSSCTTIRDWFTKNLNSSFNKCSSANDSSEEEGKSVCFN